VIDKKAEPEALARVTATPSLTLRALCLTAIYTVCVLNFGSTAMGSGSLAEITGNSGFGTAFNF
jgi:hypothetical protein